MRRIVLGAPLVVMIAMTAGRLLAQSAATVLPPAVDEAVVRDAERVRQQVTRGGAAGALLTRLARATLSGREPATAGDSIALEMLRHDLEGLGFDSVWTQPVPVTVWRDGMASLWAVGSSQTVRLVAGAIANSGVTPDSGILAGVVTVTSFAAIPRLRADQVQGRIVFVNRPMIRAQDGRSFGEVNGGRVPAVERLRRMGAAGVVLRAHGTDQSRSPHSGGVPPFPDRQVPVLTVPNPDADHLAAMLESEPELRLRLFSSGRSVPVVTHNLIAEKRGRSRPDEIVLAGAHLDSWGPGVSDDAAGIATVVAAVKGVLDAGAAERTLRLALFGAEEVGIVGARAYVSTAPRTLLAVEADQGAGEIYRIRHELPPSMAPLVEAWRLLFEPLGIDVATERSIAGPDLIPLRSQGTHTFDLAQDMRDFFDYQHTENDTLDKVDLATVDRNAGVYAGAIFAALNVPGSPAPEPSGRPMPGAVE